MNIEKTTYKQWVQAYRCTIGLMELIVVTEIGPRIMSFKLKGKVNILYEDKTNFSVGDWKIYGGHRFTTAPETNDTYQSDNEPCEVTIAYDRIIIAAPVADSNCLRVCNKINDTFLF